AIIRIKMDGVIQENDVLHTVAVFIVAYLGLIFVGSVVGALFGLDLLTAFSGSLACLGNVGPGFGEVGSMDNYSAMPTVIKMTNSLLMLFGRLEIFGVIQLCMIKWWK
ncbi:MAG: TrkH family potassium uptake protein, partial [Alistipes sp.]|nr:TrkH family potassium uptake protein [Alistipes sp.]